MNKIDLLYTKLSQIGFSVRCSLEEEIQNVDIERTIVEACYYVDEDGRLLSLLFSWLKIHGSHIIPDKLFKEYAQMKKYLGDTLWFSAICAYMASIKDPRFKKGIQISKKVHHYMNQDQASLIKMKGAVPFLKAIGILVSESSLRIRQTSILSSDELVRLNRQYRNRYLFGANWRSEIITAIQNGANTPISIAKELGIARSGVGKVFKEYTTVKAFYNFQR